MPIKRETVISHTIAGGLLQMHNMRARRKGADDWAESGQYAGYSMVADFAKQRYAEKNGMTGILEPVPFSELFTYTRSGEAENVDLDGKRSFVGANVPRFDGAEGIVLEKAGQNIFINPRDTSDIWAFGEVTRDKGAGARLNPFGEVVPKYIAGTSNVLHHILPNRTIENTTYTAGVTYAFQALVAPGGYNTVHFENPALGYAAGFANWSGDAFDLVAGTYSGANPGSVKITKYPDGWCHIEITSTCTTTGTARQFPVVFMNIYNVFVGDGVKGIYVDYCQTEVAGSCSSLIKPVAGQVTNRSQDLLNLVFGADWWNKSRGCFVIRGMIYQDIVTPNRRILCVGGTSSLPEIQVGRALRVYDGLGGNANTGGQRVTVGTPFTAKVAWAADKKMRVCLDNGAVITSGAFVSGIIDAATFAYVGRQADGGAMPDRLTLQSIGFIPNADFTDAQLSALNAIQ